MYDTVLVTLEATPTDLVIIEHIEALATRLHSCVVLLHDIDGMAALIHGPAPVSPEIIRETAYLEKIREELRAVGVPCGPQ